LGTKSKCHAIHQITKKSLKISQLNYRNRFDWRISASPAAKFRHRATTRSASGRGTMAR
jgi:hypothetical protein